MAPVHTRGLHPGNRRTRVCVCLCLRMGLKRRGARRRKQKLRNSTVWQVPLWNGERITSNPSAFRSAILRNIPPRNVPRGYAFVRNNCLPVYTISIISTIQRNTNYLRGIAVIKGRYLLVTSPSGGHALPNFNLDSFSAFPSTRFSNIVALFRVQLTFSITPFFPFLPEGGEFFALRFPSICNFSFRFNHQRNSFSRGRT